MLRPIACALSAFLACAALPAAAQVAAPKAEPAKPAPVLKRLPASAAELSLAGEWAAQDVPVYLSPLEAARATQFRLAFTNAISVAPERSTVTVQVNGRQVLSTPVNAGTAPRMLVADLPPGLVVAGFNAVRITVSQRHRVDCTVPATYELWTAIDGAASGFTGPALALTAVRKVRDLPALQAGPDGGTHLRLRMPEDAEASALARGLAIVQAIALAGRLPHPVVEVSPEPGEGPGLDILLSDGAVMSGEPVALAQAPTGRTQVTVPASADARQLAADLAGLLREPLAAGAAPGLKAVELARGWTVRPNEAVQLSDLGFPGTPFTGRRLAFEGRLVLPANFLTGDYDTATVSLDADYGRDLAPGSAIVVRVNGRDAAAMDLTLQGGETLRHQQFKIPLGLFHPGVNAVQFEARVPALSDAACEPAANPPSRVQIAATTSIRFGSLPEVPTIPEMSTLLNGGYPLTGESTLDLHADRQDLGPAGTLLAGIAQASGRVVDVTYRPDEAPEAGRSGLVVGPAGRLAGGLAAAAERRAALGPAWSGAAGAEGSAAPSEEVEVTGSRQGIVGRGLDMLSAMGFRFSDAARSAKVSVADDGLLFAMLPGAGQTGGPFSGSPVHLVVTARDGSALADGMAALSLARATRSLSGETASFEPASAGMRTVAAANPAYVLPTIASVGQMRYALAGLLSNNLAGYIGLVMAACLALGLFTNLLIRRLGVRQ